MIDSNPINELQVENTGMRADIAGLREQLAALQATSGYEASIAEVKIDRLEEALQRIDDWSRAYPLTVFPKPDLKRAHELLKAGGMTLDAISAHAMRHVVEGVGKIAREALENKAAPVL